MLVLPDPSLEFNVRLPGQYYDKETGLHYNKYRHYDPSIGRYISEDPIGQSGGLNTFLYVANSPLKFVDPDGLKLKYANPYTRGAVDRARAYYAENGVSDPFTALEDSDLTYTVDDNNSGDQYYNPADRTIHWDPTSGYSIVCGQDEDGTQSPALVLLHEGEHAKAHDENPEGFGRRREEPDPDGYTNAEERRVITGPEADAAARLGETSRSGHFGTPTPVGCVSCRK